MTINIFGGNYIKEDYYPQANIQELEMTYEMAKQDIEYWKSKDYEN